MSRDRVSRIHDRVKRFLAEDHAEHLSHLRDFVRRLPDARFGRKRMRTLAGLAGLIDSVIPVAHVARMRRGAPKPLETLRHPDADELADAVVQRLRPSRFWKLVLGFVPIVGPIAAYRLDVALALRFHDRATQYFRDLKSAGIRPCRRTSPSRRHRENGETERRTAPRTRCDERSSAFSPSTAPRSIFAMSAAWRESESPHEPPGGSPGRPGWPPT